MNNFSNQGQLESARQKFIKSGEIDECVPEYIAASWKNSAQFGIVDLYANYDYSKDVNELTGYTVTTLLTVKNLDVDGVGELLDEAGDAGVNVINGISFDYTETEAAYDKALDAAMDRAQEKAEKLAIKEGCRLEKILSVDEGTSSGSLGNDTRMYAESASADGGAMNVMPGESDVTATVTVTYQLVQN